MYLRCVCWMLVSGKPMCIIYVCVDICERQVVFDLSFSFSRWLYSMLGCVNACSCNYINCLFEQIVWLKWWNSPKFKCLTKLHVGFMTIFFSSLMNTGKISCSQSHHPLFTESIQYTIWTLVETYREIFHCDAVCISIGLLFSHIHLCVPKFRLSVELVEQKRCCKAIRFCFEYHRTEAKLKLIFCPTDEGMKRQLLFHGSKRINALQTEAAHSLSFDLHLCKFSEIFTKTGNNWDGTSRVSEVCFIIYWLTVFWSTLLDL